MSFEDWLNTFEFVTLLDNFRNSLGLEVYEITKQQLKSWLVKKHKEAVTRIIGR